jgi:hypothetical protein
MVEIVMFTKSPLRSSGLRKGQAEFTKDDTEGHRGIAYLPTWIREIRTEPPGLGKKRRCNGCFRARPEKSR